MVDMNKILDEAIARDASDVHLVSNNKPILRIMRRLEEIEEMDVLTEEDMTEVAKIIASAVFSSDNEEELKKLREKSLKLCKKYPLYNK